mgnify:CR=1 FL=1
MANPVNRHSVQGASAPTIGDDTRGRGHHHVGLFVSIDADPSAATLDVALEVSPDGDRWAPALSVSGSDFAQDESSGEYTAYIQTPGAYADFLRANVTAYDGSGNIDAYVLAGGNAGQGVRGNP